jgi:ATP-dependent RNA helicase DOB1
MGKSFPEVTAKTDMFEGSIIRLLRRLEELMRELSAAAAAIGNSELQTKFEAPKIAQKRDRICWLFVLVIDFGT